MARTKTSFRKGEAKGKPKGALNHTTKDIREAYQRLIENNLDNMQSWLKEIATKDPTKAMTIILYLSEYIIPKMARSEIDLKSNSGERVIFLKEKVREDDESEQIDYSKLSENCIREILAASKKDEISKGQNNG